MSDLRRKFDVLVVGAGPAGIAAACCAADSSARAGIVDNNPRPGGQIWRGGRNHAGTADARSWFQRLESSPVEILDSTEVYDSPMSGCLLAQSPQGECELYYKKLILCTGARERFIPFPGWTLPNVVGAGGLQALVKSGFEISGKKIVVAGTGPLLLAVAAYLREHGADVRVVAEQAPWSRLIPFGISLAGHWQKIAQLFQFKRQLAGVPFRASCWPIAAEGDGRVESVTLRSGNKTWRESCDFLACGFHLVPNIELASLLGCELRDGFVHVDENQQTSKRGIFCAGEPTGVGGVELSLIEGQIAGLAATNQPRKASQLAAKRENLRDFSQSLEKAFALRGELAALPNDDTIVCRCEDVTFGRLRSHSSWRDAKLHTRCGMGPCQARICGPAAEFLLGWQVESVRPPIFPAPVETLIARNLAERETAGT